MSEVKKAFLLPSRSVNGTGIMHFGYAPLSSDTYEITRWLAFFYIPLLPLSSWEIRPIKVTLNPLNTRYSFDILGRRALKFNHVVRVYGIAALALLPIITIFFLLRYRLSHQLELISLAFSIGWMVTFMLAPQLKHSRIYQDARAKAVSGGIDVPDSGIKPNDWPLPFSKAAKADETIRLLLYAPILLSLVGVVICAFDLLGYFSVGVSDLPALFGIGVGIFLISLAAILARYFFLRRLFGRGVLVTGVVTHMDFNEHNSQPSSSVPVYCAYSFHGRVCACRMNCRFADLDGTYRGSKIELIVDPSRPTRALIRQMFA